ncbi:hypothetical protein BX616_006106 [Lobosporangium transversale]|nr:hypothetical protein BX616_006106 [Lobosporangium transversale]
MVESPEPASGTRGPRNRRQPSRQPSPTPSSRPRRSNARASGPPPVTTIKKEEPARKRRPSSMEASNLEDSANDDDEENAEERDEDEQGEGEGEEGEEGEEEVEDEKEPVPTKRPGRPSRSKRPIRNGRSVTKSRPQGDGDVVENNQASTDKADGGATEEQAEEDPEENEGEIEEAGEAKITKDGELLGGREYKCRSFRMPNRGSRIYMLSMDPARVLGFRDSYLFFLRNPSLVRINTTVEERTWMIENGMLMANFKSKLIAVVTARSIFKMFGHRIIKRGRSKIDDYYESRAVEDDVGDESDEDMAGDPDGSQGSGTHEDGTQGRRKHTLFHTDEPVRQVTDLNWMYESAMAVRSLNTQLRTLRQENPKFLDPHTNIEQIPAAKQPTRCEVVPVLQSKKEAPSAIQSENTLNQTVLSIPHSIGPQVDAVVKVEIKEGVPPPPIIQDPAVWAVIPEDIRKALEIAEATKPKDEENEDLAKFPLSLMDGQYQAAFPIHQARFQQPYRVVLPQSMAPFAHYLHQLYTTQSRGEVGPTMEQATVLGQGDARALQWQQQHQLQQQQMQLHQKQIKNQQQQQQQQQQQIQDQPNKKLETPPVGEPNHAP